MVQTEKLNGERFRVNFRTMNRAALPHKSAKGLYKRILQGIDFPRHPLLAELKQGFSGPDRNVESAFTLLLFRTRLMVTFKVSRQFLSFIVQKLYFSCPSDNVRA